VHLDIEFASVLAIHGPQDLSMDDCAIGVVGIRLYAIRVIPEVDSIDIPVVEPQSNVVRMVDALAGSGIEREAASDNGASRRPERIEDGLFDSVGPDVGGERLAVHRNVNAVC